MVRKLWPGYVALYKSTAGDKVVIKSVEFPPKTRTLKGQGGLRKYRRIKYQQHLQEVLIVAKATKTKVKASQVTDDEIDELDTVDDLDDLEEEDLDEEEPDEDEDEDEEDEDEDEDDEDEDEEPAPKKSKKKATKPKTSRAAANGKVGTAEVAAAAGIDSRRLRMLLRKKKIEKDEETGRYEWSSLNHKVVKAILKAVKAGEADEIVKEQLDKLKADKAAGKNKKKKASKDAGAKTKNKKKKVVEEEDDDE